jgi:hypothetical protein
MSQLPSDSGDVTNVEHTIAPADSGGSPPSPSPTDVAPAPEPSGPPPGEPAPETTPPEPGFGARLTELGIQLPEGVDDAAIAQDYIAQRRTAYELQQQLQQTQQQLQQFQYAQQQAVAAEQEPATAEPAKPEDQPFFVSMPDFRPEQRAYLWRNPDTGLIEIKPGTTEPVPPDLPSRYANYEHAIATNQDRFFRDHEKYMQAREDAAQERFLKAAAEQQAQLNQQQYEAQEAERQYNAVLYDNKNDFFVMGQNGEPVIDPVTGQTPFSQKGQVYNQYVHQLVQAGNRPSEVPLMALQMVNGFQGSTPSPATIPGTSTPAPLHPADAQREAFLTTPTHQPGRAGSQLAAQSPGGPPQNSELTEEQALMATARQLGFK